MFRAALLPPRTILAAEEKPKKGEKKKEPSKPCAVSPQLSDADDDAGVSPLHAASARRSDAAAQDEDPTSSGMANDTVHDAAEKGVAAAHGKIDETVAAATAAVAGDAEEEAKAAQEKALKEAAAAQAALEEAITKRCEQKLDRAMKLFFLYSYIALSYWALAEYFWLAPFPQGEFVRCQLVYVVAAPLYKPLSLSMWASLMAVAHFAFWFRHHKKQPGKKEKENDDEDDGCCSCGGRDKVKTGNYSGVYPGESQLDDCRGVWFAVFLVMLPFLAWLIVAVVFLPLVIIFFPLPFIVMGLAPVVITYLPSFLLGNAKERIGGVVMIVPSVVGLIVLLPVLVCVGGYENIPETWRCFKRLVDFWGEECAERVAKIFTSRQQTEAHATLMLKVFAVQVWKERARATRTRTRA